MDNPHLKSKENFCKKALEFTNLKANLYQIAFLQCKLLCVIKPYMVIFSCCFVTWSKKSSTTPGAAYLFLLRSLFLIYQCFIHNRIQIHGHILLFQAIVQCHVDLLEIKLGQNKKFSGSNGPNKLLKTGKFPLSQGSVNRKFVLVVLDILGLFLSLSSCVNKYLFITKLIMHDNNSSRLMLLCRFVTVLCTKIH